MTKAQGSPKRPVVEQFEKLWSQALLAVSTAEDEAGKLVHKVSDFAGWSQDEARRHIREFSERLVTQRRDLEKSVEESVKRALAGLTLPRREDIAAFEARLNRVAERLEALGKR